MSEPIKVGDLVVVVKPGPCCGTARTLGHVFCVAEIRVASGACCECGKVYDHEAVAVYPDGSGEPLSRLKRIDPLPESETTLTQDTVKA